MTERPKDLDALVEMATAFAGLCEIADDYVAGRITIEEAKRAAMVAAPPDCDPKLYDLSLSMWLDSLTQYKRTVAAARGRMN